jgi:general secretion pathway protein G
MKRSSPFKVRSSRLKVKDALFHPSSLIPHPCRAGFTLIEILVVLVIIMILVGIVASASKYAMGKAARSRAQSEIAMMETALESYKSDNGIYPTSTGANRLDAKNNSASLYVALTTPKTYMTFKVNQLQTQGGITYLLDPFGAPYNYYCTRPLQADQQNKMSFDLWSYGPDGQDNTVDDLMNWKQ